MIDYNEIAMRYLTTADVAKVRLHGIVAADRESAPCWRWRFNGFTGPIRERFLWSTYPRKRLSWEQRR